MKVVGSPLSVLTASTVHEICRARPARPLDPVPVADVPCQIVLGDHFAHIGLDFLRCRDRRADPRLEAIAEGVEVAVGADAGITMGQPGAAEILLALQDDKTRARQLRRQVIGAADAGNAGADDQDIEMLGGFRDRRNRAGRGEYVHVSGSCCLASLRHVLKGQSRPAQCGRSNGPITAQNPTPARPAGSSRDKASAV